MSHAYVNFIFSAVSTLHFTACFIVGHTETNTTMWTHCRPPAWPRVRLGVRAGREECHNTRIFQCSLEMLPPFSKERNYQKMPPAGPLTLTPTPGRPSELALMSRKVASPFQGRGLGPREGEVQALVSCCHHEASTQLVWGLVVCTEPGLPVCSTMHAWTHCHCPTTKTPEALESQLLLYSYFAAGQQQDIPAVWKIHMRRCTWTHHSPQPQPR